MLPLNVPFLPEKPYVDFLADLGSRLHSVHFSLQDPALADARVRMQHQAPQNIVDHLARLQHPKKYLLANGRFQTTDVYQKGESLQRIIQGIEYLLEADVLDGLIFADSYLISTLAVTVPKLAERLEAVPSINFGIDNMDKLEVLLEMISNHGFRQPSKFTLDRSLNRHPKALAVLGQQIHQRHPHIKIELLANEGCLHHCPFRSTHEALIAAANAGMGIDTLSLNRDLACIRVLHRAPHRIFTSPYIRPEDTIRYAGSVDIIKICGRTLGAEFLKRTVDAYATGRYQGNLLDLLDASHWMAEHWEIPNHNLPDDHFDILNDGHTLTTTCKSLFERNAHPRPLRIKSFTEVNRSCPE